MRSIGTIEDSSRAHAFAAYLASIHIETDLSEKDTASEIWVLDEDQLDKAREELAAYLANPDDKRFAVAKRNRPSSRETIRPEQKSRTIQMRERWQRQPASGGSPLTFLLAVFCIIVTIMGNFGRQEGAFEIIRMSRSAYLEWELWRFITPIFSHGDWIHLLFNLMWLYQLGGMIEQRRGTETLLGMTVLFALASNSLEFFARLYSVTGQGFAPEIAEGFINFHGFSGVNYGLFGYIWIKGKLDPWENVHVHPSTVTILLIWYVVCIAGIMGPVANWAHTGGLISGALWGFADARIARYRRGMR